MRKLIVAFVFFLPIVAAAQSFGTSASAGGAWDFSVGLIYQDSLSAGGEGDSGNMAMAPDTSSLKVDSAIGFGANFAYNFTEHLALGLDIDYLNPDYEALLVPDDPNESAVTIKHELSQWNFRLKGTYSFLEGPLVPYVDLGFAWTNVDSNVIEGEPITGCWWDPWWGYICQNFYNTFSSTETGWGGGVGLRYHFVGDSFLKFSWNRWELDAGGNSDDLTLESFRLEYGWRF